MGEYTKLCDGGYLTLKKEMPRLLEESDRAAKLIMKIIILRAAILNLEKQKGE